MPIVRADENNDAFQNAFQECDWVKASVIARESKDALDLMNRFALVERQLKERMGSLKAVVESLKPMPLIVPALQWAQSPTHIFLNVKFAHIISAPATLNVEVTNTSFSDTGMHLEATDGRKLFRLELDFFGRIDGSQSTYQMASVGRMTFNIKKESEASRWGKLVSRKSKGQVSLWYTMHEQHVKELEKLKEEGADSDEDDEGSKKKEKDKEVDKEKEKEKEKAEEEDNKPSEAESAEGTIVTPSDAEAKEKKIARKNELASSIAELERRAKQRKRDLDFDLVERKKEVRPPDCKARHTSRLANLRFS